MKIIKFIILLILCNCYLTISAQDEFPCVNNVSTDWRNPSNNSGYNVSGRYTNSFNWFPMDNDGRPIGLATKYNANNMSSLYTFGNNYSHHYEYLNKIIQFQDVSKYPLPENGWELLGMNLGFYPNKDTYPEDMLLNNANSETKFVILYNKYEGKIRLFAENKHLINQNGNYNTIQVSLFTYNTSILNFNKTINNNDLIFNSHAFVHPPSTSNSWFVADFMVTYDPCICTNISNLVFNFKFINNTKITLLGGGIELNTDIVSAEKLVSEDYLNNVSSADNNQNIDGGFLIYKDINNLLDKYIKDQEEYLKNLKDVNEHNERIKKQLVIVKIAKDLALSGSVGLVGLLGKEYFVKYIDELKKDENYKKIIDEIIPKPDEFVKSIQKDTKKFLGEKFENFISENFITKNPPKSPIQPTVSYSQFKFEGTLSTSSPATSINISTPGSKIISSAKEPYNYPVYNEPLGVFALLENPEIKISKSDYRVNRIVKRVSCQPGYGCLANIGVDYEETIQFKMNNKDILYLFNPVLNFKYKNIKVAMVIEFDVNEYTLSKRKRNENNTIFVYPNNPSISYSNIEVNNLEINNDTKNKTAKVVTDYFDINNLNKQVFEFFITSKSSQINGAISTPPPPPNPMANISIKNIYFKILINAEYEGLKGDNETKKEYNYFYTYNLNNNEIQNNEIILNNLQNLVNPEDFIIVNNHNQCEDISKLETEYDRLCKAKDKISIQGTMLNNIEDLVLFEAGNSISFLPGTHIKQESHFKINSGSYTQSLSQPNLGASKNEINKICENKVYNKSFEINEDVLVNTSKVTEHFDLYPNPASSFVNINVKTNQENCNVNIIDVNGKIIKTILLNKIGLNFTEQLDLSNISKGVYFVQVYLENSVSTKKLIVQ